MACVYIISDDSGAVKVGYTNGHPADRLASLQTGNPRALRLVAEIPTDDAPSLEALIHRALKHRRGVGEWFYPTQDEIDLVVRELKGGDAPAIIRSLSQSAAVQPLHTDGYSHPSPGRKPNNGPTIARLDAKSMCVMPSCANENHVATSRPVPLRNSSSLYAAIRNATQRTSKRD